MTSSSAVAAATWMSPAAYPNADLLGDSGGSGIAPTNLTGQPLAEACAYPPNANAINQQAVDRPSRRKCIARETT